MNRIEFLANLDKYKGEDHSTFLEHYGILGQKWGTRRWQNADGTFNTEGKIRYFGSQKAQAERNAADEQIGGYVADHFHKKIINKSDRNTLKKIKKYPDIYNTEGLTDEEILQAIRRVAKIPNGTAYGRAIRQELYNTQLNKTRSKYYDSNTKDISEDNLENQKIGGLFSKKDTGPDVDPIKMKNMGYLPGIDEPVIFTDKKGTYDFGDVKKNYDVNLSKFINKKDLPIAKKYRDDIEKMFDRFTGLTPKELEEGQEMLNSITDEHEKKVVSKCLSVMLGSQVLNPGEGMEIRFAGKPGKGQNKEVSEDLFTKKNEKGRSETADKMEDAAKEFRKDGDEKLAEETEKTAQEMRDATKMTPDRKNMTKEEKKELRKAVNNCWKTVNKGAWVSWFLFGLPGYAVNSVINWALVKETAARVGIDGKSKTWTAADWNKITDTIMDTYPRKYKKEIAKRDAERNQSQE